MYSQEPAISHLEIRGRVQLQVHKAKQNHPGGALGHASMALSKLDVLSEDVACPLLCLLSNPAKRIPERWLTVVGKERVRRSVVPLVTVSWHRRRHTLTNSSTSMPSQKPHMSHTLPCTREASHLTCHPNLLGPRQLCRKSFAICILAASPPRVVRFGV